MRTQPRFTKWLVFLLAASSLAGCLSSDSDESASGFTDTPGAPGPGNSAPTISGNPPAAVLAGETYSFAPNASDPDGDTLSFSIQNKPAWAQFDTTNGSLTGAPTLEDVGTYANIQISVSDGQASIALPAFAIEVTQVATGSATLSWLAPTQNEDGSPLVDLAGYKIYYGTSSRDYTNTINVDNPGVTTYVVENLSPGTYYFAATALNAAGEESRFSGEATKTLN